MTDEQGAGDVTVGQLIEQLSKLPADAVVILAADGEGNSFSLLAADDGAEVGWYDPEADDRVDLFVADGDADGDEDYRRAVCLWPIG